MPPTDLPTLLAKCRNESKQAAALARRFTQQAAVEQGWAREQALAMAGFHRGVASGLEYAALNVEHVMHGTHADPEAIPALPPVECDTGYPWPPITARPCTPVTVLAGDEVDATERCAACPS